MEQSERGIRREKNETGFRPGKNYLLAIGIDAYQYCGKLNNAKKDAKDLIKLLASEYAFEPSRIISLFDEEATHDKIDEKLRWFALNLTEDDSLLVYFSGHGFYDELKKEGYWIPVEARYNKTTDYIPYSALLQMIKAIPTRHTFFIVDSCYSGAAFVETRDFKTATRFEKDPSRWMFASGRNEVVPDGVSGENSPFAEQLLKTLKNYADQGIRVSSLIEKVITATIYNSKQTPIGRPLFGVGDGGGEFFFRPKGEGEAQVYESEPVQEGIDPVWDLVDPPTDDSWGIWPRYRRQIFVGAYLILMAALMFLAFKRNKNLDARIDLKVSDFSFRNFQTNDLFYNKKLDYLEMENCNKAIFNGDSLFIDEENDNRFNRTYLLDDAVHITPSFGLSSTRFVLKNATLSALTIPDSAMVFLHKRLNKKNELHLNLEGIDERKIELQFQDRLTFETGSVGLQLAGSKQEWGSAVWGAVGTSSPPGTVELFNEDYATSLTIGFADSIDFEVNNIKIDQPKFLLHDQNKPVSSIIHGKVYWLDHHHNVVDSINLPARENLAILPTKKLSIRKLEVVPGGFELSMEGKVKRLHTGGFLTIRNPNVISWWWHTRKLELGFISILMLGLLYVISGKSLDAFLKAIGALGGFR